MISSGGTLCRMALAIARPMQRARLYIGITTLTVGDRNSIIGSSCIGAVQRAGQSPSTSV